MAEAITILISVRDRPVYLWACLDSLYRNTRYPHSFVLLDMASEDPMTANVIAGFARRGMFSKVIQAPRNHPKFLWSVIESLIAGTAEYFSYVDGDVVVEESNPCWLGAFVALMEQNERLAMVGPAIDKRDFISWERARVLEPDLDDELLAGLVKLHSPERHQNLHSAQGGLAYPHNPPGRLLLTRRAALAQVGTGTDGALDRKLRGAGYETGIAPGVRHRHLSLLNLFDYPEFDVAQRDAFMKLADTPN